MAPEAFTTTGRSRVESAALMPCLPTDAARVWQQLKVSGASGEGASPPPEPPVGVAAKHDAARDADRSAAHEAALAQARAEAGQIIATARETAQRLHQEAEQARAEAQRSRADTQKAFDEALELLVSQFDEQLSGRLEQMEREVPDIIIEMAEKVIGQRIERDSEVVVGVVRAALRQVAGAREIEALVNPADAPAVRAAQMALLQEHGGGLLSIVGSDEVDRGGAVVRTEHGEVDARIRVQLAALAQAVRGQIGGQS